MKCAITFKCFKCVHWSFKTAMLRTTQKNYCYYIRFLLPQLITLLDNYVMRCFLLSIFLQSVQWVSGFPSHFFFIMFRRDCSCLFLMLTIHTESFLGFLGFIKIDFVKTFHSWFTQYINTIVRFLLFSVTSFIFF